MTRAQEIAQRVETAMVDGGFRLTIIRGRLAAYDLLHPDNAPVGITVQGKTPRGIKARAMRRPLR